MRTVHRCIGVCFAFVLATGCAGDDTMGGHRAAGGAPIWTLCDEAKAVMGSTEDTKLFRVTGAIFTASDEFLVANEGSVGLLFFDPSGELLRRAGRRGPGPAEFLSLGLVPNWSSDSIIVFDRRSQQVSVLDSQGHFGRSLRMRSEGGVPLDRRVEVLGRMRDSRFLVRVFHPRSAEGQGVVRAGATISLHGPDGMLEIDLGTYPGDETLFAEYEGLRITSPLPFLGRLVVAAGPDRAVLSYGRDLDVTTVPSSDFMVSRFRSESSHRAVTWEDYSAWVEEELLSIRAPAAIDETRKYYHHIYAPWELQAVDRMFIDDLERVWVGSEWFRAEAEWLVLDRYLQPTAIVRLPPRFRLLSVKGMEAMVVVEDELGRESVEMRCITEGAPQSQL